MIVYARLDKLRSAPDDGGRVNRLSECVFEAPMRFIDDPAPSHVIAPHVERRCLRMRLPMRRFTHA